MKNTNVSFIVPAYNCAKFLPDAINSIYKGNFTNGDETIIVDDASTDKTFKVATSLQRKYPSIHIYRHHYNKGSAAAGRNTGIDNSKNELIFCLDADNVLCANSIPKLKQYMIDKKSDAVAFGGQYYFKEDVDRVTHKWIYYSKIALEKCINESNKTPGPSGNYLFTKNSWLKAGKYFEPTLINQTLDSWTFLTRQLATGSKVLTLKDTYYFHRYGHDSHYYREYNKGNLSISALIALLPFLEFLDNSSVEYIMGKEGRYSWFSDIKNSPIRFKKPKAQANIVRRVLFSFMRIINSK